MVPAGNFAYAIRTQQPEAARRVKQELDSAGQMTLVQALTNPTCYLHPVLSVQRLETHISHILLAGEYAYKIKKPLNLGFLDFTTLERRRFFCLEEVRLNRRLAPALYLECVPIGGAPAQPLLGDAATAFEYAVKMRRFAQTDLLDRCLAEGRLHAGHSDALARRLAEFHGAIARLEAQQPFGAPEQVQQPVLDNFTALRDLLADPVERALVDRLEQWTLSTFAGLRTTLAERKAAGCIRECHGDLHLGNMFLDNDQVVIFDCIEFNDALRWIDVMSDLGFLMMDLQYRGAAAFAWRLLNGYLEVSGDYDGLRVLPYYQVYRALVRAKIAAIRLQQPALSDAQRRELQTECRAHLQLAVAFTRPASPFLLLAHGVSGSGKSYASARLAEQPGAIRIRSDVERKRLFGLAPLASSHSELNRGLYTPEAGRRTYQRLETLADQILQAGYPVLVDATFLQAEQRQPFRALAAARAVPFILLACRAAPATLRARVAARQARGDDAAEADLEVLERQLQRYTPPAPDEQPLWVESADCAAVQEAVLERLQVG